MGSNFNPFFQLVNWGLEINLLIFFKKSSSGILKFGDGEKEKSGNMTKKDPWGIIEKVKKEQSLKSKEKEVSRMEVLSWMLSVTRVKKEWEKSLNLIMGMVPEIMSKKAV